MSREYFRGKGAFFVEVESDLLELFRKQSDIK